MNGRFKILISLMILVLLGGMALALPKASTYPAAFWIKGKLLQSGGQPADVSNFKVVFYTASGDPAPHYAAALSDVSGNFFINAFDDPEINLTVQPYYIGVVAKNGYGVNEADNLLALNAQDLANGYKNINLTLKAGEGIVDPTPPPPIVPTDPIVDAGWIRLTNITRSGENLTLNWDYDPAKGATPVNIYVQSANVSYVADVAQFALLAANVAAGTKTYPDNAKAHDGKNYYYRVVPATLVAGTNLLDPLNNSITVGKAQVTLPANKYVFCDLPFMEDGIALSSLVLEQAGNGGELLWWDGASYHGLTYSSGAWVGTDHNLRIGEGFILRAPAAASLALTGRFGQLATPFSINLSGNKYNLVGYPYPQSGVFETMGITPSSGSDLLRWLVDSQSYNGATNSGTAWVGPAGINTLAVADPRYYRPTSDYTWTIHTP